MGVTSEVHYQIVSRNYQTFFLEREEEGRHLPHYLKKECQRFLSCGILSQGFIRLHCYHCNSEKLVAFSCKGRTLCPRCGGRRMSDTAAHLVDHIFKEVPVRQWVLSFPFRLRYLMAYDSKIQSLVLEITVRAISSYYRQKAKRLGIISPKTGAVTIIQRFGGSVNLNPHFHMLFMDGVMKMGEFTSIHIQDEDVHFLCHRLKTRIIRSLQKRGHWKEELDENFELDQEKLGVNQLMGGSLQNRLSFGNHKGQKPAQIGKVLERTWAEPQGPCLSYLEGFSLHANVKIGKKNREGLERLARYVARPAYAKDRVERGESGQILWRLKNPWKDGTTHLKFSEEEFLERLISLIPPPRINLIRYHGVFSPRHAERSLSINKKKSKRLTLRETERIEYRTPWAELLKRVFKSEVLQCEKCKNKYEYVCEITNPHIIKKMLTHLGFAIEIVAPSPPRAPPLAYANQWHDEDQRHHQEFFMN